MYTCLLWDNADTSVVSNCIHVCCGTQQTCLLGHTADMSAEEQLLDSEDRPNAVWAEHERREWSIEHRFRFFGVSSLYWVLSNS